MDLFYYKLELLYKTPLIMNNMCYERFYGCFLLKITVYFEKNKCNLSIISTICGWQWLTKKRGGSDVIFR